MDDHDNPILRPVFEGRDLTRLSTFTEQPARPKRRSVPPAVAKIVAEIGFRYRPTATADLEAHAHALRLLAEDLADVPPHLLERAAQRWVRDNKWMPKASELVDLARAGTREAMRGTGFAGDELQAHCDRLNAMRISWRWHVVGEVPNRRVEKAA